MVSRYKSHSNFSRGLRESTNIVSQRQKKKKKEMKAKHQKNPLYILQFPHRPTLHKYEVQFSSVTQLCPTL